MSNKIIKNLLSTLKANMQNIKTLTVTPFGKLDDDCDGFMRLKGGNFHITYRPGLSELDMFEVIVHELTHVAQFSRATGVNGSAYKINGYIFSGSSLDSYWNHPLEIEARQEASAIRGLAEIVGIERILLD